MRSIKRRRYPIAAPARRGLVDNKLYKLNDFKKVTREKFLKIHAMGPSATRIIEREMLKERVKFKP